MHKDLSESVTNLSVAFPKQQSWFQTIRISYEDAAEYKRAALDEYLGSLVDSSVVAKAFPFKVFLSEADRPDWPSPVGDLDLVLHDLPHDSSATEWWYYALHFEDAEGKEYSAFCAFFRVVKHIDDASGKKSHAHALNWAFIDVGNKKYINESLLDKDSPAVVKKQLEAGMVKDDRLKRAYLEILNRGNIPLPDRMFNKDATVALDKLNLDFELAQLVKNEQTGQYHLKCSDASGKTAIDFVITPNKKPVRHGLNGVVKGHAGDDMYYYCISRCNLEGTFTVDGVVKQAVNGQAWYDHEFGGVTNDDSGTPAMDYAWNWASVQLDNNHELSVAILVDPREKPYRLMETRAIVIDDKGNRTQPTDLIFNGLNSWTSVRTFNHYPTKWELKIPSAGIDLHLEAAFDDQEFMTLIAKPGFWEGRLDATGTFNGQPVKGKCFAERNGFTPLRELTSFFKAVGRETRKAVTEVYPDVVDKDTAIQLIATPETAHYIDGVDFDVFKEGIIDPLRYISDMGGKSWRSYGALACMDVVGGDSRKYVRWLSMPEFMHVGSLIIDDIQDDSQIRRGVPCAHIKYGNAVAINAGTAAYFQGQQLLLVPGLTADQLNKVYDYYFAALRAGHAGQALDIHGLGYMMDECIESGNAALAEQRILAIHRLKTAVPAASLARMGALVGGGSDVQIEAIGGYYESVGIAFQIMDDVLNLRGMYSDKADKTEGLELKNLGEDIRAGKVTIPVVKAIGLMPKDEMRKLWDIIKTKPSDQKVINECIATLEKYGAIEACVQQSINLVEDAFKVLDPLIPDSFSKIMLRSFGWFVTERHH